MATSITMVSISTWISLTLRTIIHQLTFASRPNVTFRKQVHRNVSLEKRMATNNLFFVIAMELMLTNGFTTLPRNFCKLSRLLVRDVLARGIIDGGHHRILMLPLVSRRAIPGTKSSWNQVKSLSVAVIFIFLRCYAYSTGATICGCMIF